GLVSSQTSPLPRLRLAFALAGARSSSDERPNGRGQAGQRDESARGGALLRLLLGGGLLLAAVATALRLLLPRLLARPPPIDELDDGDGRGVAGPDAELDDAGVAALAGLVARRQLVE